jgi:hypothetical protein
MKMRKKERSPKILSIIPAYNEEKNIGKTIFCDFKDLLKKFPKLNKIPILSEVRH